MGKVLTAITIFPEENTDLNHLLEKIKEVKGCNSAKIEEFHFGAKIIKASFVCNDKEGRDFEEEVKKISGVSEVQVNEVGLIT